MATQEVAGTFNAWLDESWPADVDSLSTRMRFSITPNESGPYRIAGLGFAHTLGEFGVGDEPEIVRADGDTDKDLLTEAERVLLEEILNRVPNDTRTGSGLQLGQGPDRQQLARIQHVGGAFTRVQTKVSFLRLFIRTVAVKAAIRDDRLAFPMYYRI